MNDMVYIWFAFQVPKNKSVNKMQLCGFKVCCICINIYVSVLHMCLMDS